MSSKNKAYNPYRPAFDRAIKPDIEQFMKAVPDLEDRRQVFQAASQGKEIPTPTQKEETGKGKEQWDERKDAAVYSYDGYANITNLDQALAFSKVDLETWEVERHTFNTWTTTMQESQKWNIQVKIWFKKRSDKTTFAKFKKALIEDIQTYSPPSIIRQGSNKKSNPEHLALINIYDTHLEKLAQAEETNDTYNHHIAQSRFLEATNSLLNKCDLYKAQKLIFPIGNDFFHVNGDTNTTKRGTPQDVSTRSKHAFRLGLHTVRQAIDQCLYYYPHIEIPIIYGNHDPDKTFYLGEALSAIYENNPKVTINNQFVKRKYYTHGTNLLGFAHGDQLKRKLDQIPAIMADEASEHWHNTKHRILYLGDLHHIQTFKFLAAKDKIGVEARFLRSVGGTDKWHHDSAYIGVPKTAHASIFHKTEGPMVLDIRQHF